MSKKSCEGKCTIRICGTGSIGTKWQIVIPKEARDVMWLSPGDSVTFMLKDEKILWVIPNDSIEHLMDYIESEKNATLIK